jgi:hypothetical protein
MKGEVVYLYAFDVADEIVPEKVSEILAKRPFPLEIRTDHTSPRDMPLYKPLAIELPPLRGSLAGQDVRPLIRVYNVGVVSIALRVPLEVASLAELLPLHRGGLEDGRTLDVVARELCDQACQSLREAMIQPGGPSEPEAYTVFCLTDVGGQRNANDWLAGNRQAVAELLAESGPGGLSPAQVDEVLRIQRTYSPADVVVIDWDAALIVDLTGYVDDVLYVLELANLQLEEYRMMDQRLDRYLDRAYDDLRKRPFGLLGVRTGFLDTLRLLRVDVAKLNDEVTHISKFFGDWYLARVYLGARERFHLGQWQQSVAGRLGQLDELYSVANADVNNRRMVWLETLIVILFLIDLLMIALGK